MNRLGTGRFGVRVPTRKRVSFLQKISDLPLDPTNLAFSGYWRSFLGWGRPRRIDHSLPFSAELKNEWSCKFTPLICLYDKDRNFNLFLTRKHNCEKGPLSSSCLPVCLYVHMERLGSYWTDFHEVWYLNIFSKICWEFKMTGIIGIYWRSVHIYDYNSLSSS